jgi:DNA-directed RNA polymerase specialized sigma24 family protein
MFLELMLALNNGNREDAEQYAKNVSEVMVDYLVVRHRADRNDAWDAAQQTILILLERGEQIQLRDASKAMAFVLKILRNEHLRILRNTSGAVKESLEMYEAQIPKSDHLDAMVTRERMYVLHHCIGSLSQINRQFILHFMDQTWNEAEKLAQKLQITVNSAWTRKHRIIRSLSDCMRRKLKS